jgi:histone deacetylase 1/2
MRKMATTPFHDLRYQDLFEDADDEQVQAPDDAGPAEDPAGAAPAPAVWDDDDDVEVKAPVRRSNLARRTGAPAGPVAVAGAEAKVPAAVAGAEVEDPGEAGQQVDQADQPGPDGDVERRTSSRSRTLSQKALLNLEQENNVLVAKQAELRAEVNATVLTRSQARKDPRFMEAIKAERTKLEGFKAWEVVPRPAGAATIGSKHAFALKDMGGELKARLCARGDQVDYEVEDYSSPVSSLYAVRMALTLGSRWHIRVCDVSSAYVHAELKDDEKIYMEIPDEGYEDIDRTKFVFKLHRALYGMKQSGKRWFDLMTTYLAELDFECVGRMTDRAFFVRKVAAGGGKATVVLYVDDFVIACQERPTLDRILKTLGNKVKLQVQELPTGFLSMHIERRGDKTIKLTQKELILKLQRELNMIGCNGIATPATADKIEPRGESEEPCPRDVSMPRMLGMLQYLVQGTRPDVAFITNQLARYQADPSTRHFQALKRVVRYLVGTMELGLVIRPCEEKELIAHGYVDADHRKDKSHSTGGYVIFVGPNPVYWRSYKESILTDSTAHAEIVAASEGLKDLLHIKYLLEGMGVRQPQAVLLREDNQAVVSICNQQGVGKETMSRLRHIDHKDAIVAEQAQLGNVRVEKVDTKDNRADIFTKSLAKEPFERLRSELNVLE